MPRRETARQRRWSFAAEARGELPKGTALRWARESRANVEKERRNMARRKKMKKVLCTRCGKTHRRGACPMNGKKPAGFLKA